VSEVVDAFIPCSLIDPTSNLLISLVVLEFESEVLDSGKRVLRNINDVHLVLKLEIYLSDSLPSWSQVSAKSIF